MSETRDYSIATCSCGRLIKAPHNPIMGLPGQPRHIGFPGEPADCPE
ncbi:hypothetical protein ACFWBI_08975 [Streptomyces sp. NPDC059982]